MKSPCFAAAILAMILPLTWAPAPANGQPTFSIDFQGPTARYLGAGPVSAGDILTPMPPGQSPPPLVVIPAAAGPGTLGLSGGTISEDFEVDALSYGLDGRYVEMWQAEPLFDDPALRTRWSFSVDEFAVGLPSPFPSISTEGALGAMEASADVYVCTTSIGPFPPGPLGFNTGLYDGNGGMTPFPAPGLNLVEPNPPSVQKFPSPMGRDDGDNLDAWDLETPPPLPDMQRNVVYFSLDSIYTMLPDPLEPAPPVNSGTAAAHGFVGGDVLQSNLSGAPPTLYADSRQLGLNGGVFVPGQPNELDEDDLDALVLWENGIPDYQPVEEPYGWLRGADMLLYSVRRNSAVINTPDALFGMPITEGDVLVPVAIGPNVYAPGIFIPAEALGLSTVRMGGGASWGVINPKFEADQWSDDLNALDVEQVVPIADGTGDGKVGGADFLVWQRGFGLSGPGVSPAVGDFDLNYVVDGADLALWEAQFGLGYPATPVAREIAEPPSWPLFGIAAIAMFAWRRRLR